VTCFFSGAPDLSGGYDLNMRDIRRGRCIAALLIAASMSACAPAVPPALPGQSRSKDVTGEAAVRRAVEAGLVEHNTLTLRLMDGRELRGKVVLVAETYFEAQPSGRAPKERVRFADVSGIVPPPGFEIHVNWAAVAGVLVVAGAAFAWLYAHCFYAC
jgi:hypothetical protein